MALRRSRALLVKFNAVANVLDNEFLNGRLSAVK